MTQLNASSRAPLLLRILRRTLTVAAVAITLEWVVQRSSALLDHDASAATRRILPP